MAWHDPFQLGPLGAMRELPSPPAGASVDVDPQRFGGLFEALGGAAVVDVWSIRRSWSFEWPDELPVDVAAIVRAWHGLDRRVRRLLDPMHGANLASLDVSTCGAASRTLRRFDVGARAVSFAPLTDAPAELVGVVGGLRWSVAESSADVLRADLVARTPTLGRETTVSAYVRGSGTAQVAAEPYAAGASSPSALVRGAATALTGSWQRLKVTVPAGAVESVVPALAVASGPARIVESVGWQVEHPHDPTDNHDGPAPTETPTRWVMGGGCPKVALVGTGYGYRRLNRRSMKLTLREID